MFFRGITPAELMNAQGRARRERTRKWPLERAAHLVTAGISWAQIRNLIQVLVQAWRRFHLEGKAPGKTTAKPESEPIPSLGSPDTAESGRAMGRGRKGPHSRIFISADLI
jgi:hypothetical protein